MSFPTGLRLYADPESKPKDWRQGLVADISIPPPGLKHNPVKLIVVMVPKLARQNLQETGRLIGQFPLIPPVDTELINVGLQAINLEDVPEDQRGYWEREVAQEKEAGQGRRREALR